MPATTDTQRLRKLLVDNREAVDSAIGVFGFSNPRVFGSVARGTAALDSDIDLLVDAAGQDAGTAFMNALRCGEDLQTLLGVKVDVVVPELAKEKVMKAAAIEGIPLCSMIDLLGE